MSGFTQTEIWKYRSRCQRAFAMVSCDICGGEQNLQRHHLDGDISNNTEANVEIVCQDCHTASHMELGNWGRGQVQEKVCPICGTKFKPKRSRVKLCGSPECHQANGRRSAELRWKRQIE